MWYKAIRCRQVGGSICEKTILHQLQMARLLETSPHVLGSDATEGPPKRGHSFFSEK